MKTKSDWVNYPADFPLDKEAAENILMLKAALGDPDEEEFRDYMVRCAQRRQARQEAAMKSAKALLRQAKHPVGRKDMLQVMEEMIMHQVSNYERMDTVPNAVSLVAGVICLNLLKDGPLHEGV